MLKIAIAKTPEQIDEVLKLRHRLLVDHNSQETTGGSKDTQTRLMDRFDAFPETTHLVAIERNRIIGSLRLVMDSGQGHTGLGLPVDALTKEAAEQSKPIREHFPAGSALMGCDLYCVEKNVSAEQATRGLLLMASYVAISKRASHMVAAVKPEAVELLKPAGFRELQIQRETLPKAAGEATDKTTDEATETGTEQRLITLDVRQDLKDSFVQFSEENELEDLMHAYGCALYQPGESILRAGTAGNCAFVITEGKVDVRHPGNRVSVDTMGVGEVFGELALLTDQVRSADIIASTEVRTMVLEKSIFVEHLMADPKAALKLLTSMGHRMKHLIDYCNTLAA